MRLRSVVQEALRDINAGVAAVPLLAIIVASALLGGLLIDLLTIGQLIQRAEKFQMSGGSVMTVQAPGRIDPVACESLNQVAGVRAAGALPASREHLTPALLPRSRVDAYDVTASIPTLLRSSGMSAGIHISAGVASAVGARTGSETQFVGHGRAQVAGIYPWVETDGRRAGFGHTAMIPVSVTDPFDECWIDAWPTSPDTRMLLQLTTIPGDRREPPLFGQLNTTMGARFDGAADFWERPTRWVPAASSILLFALGSFTIWRRRLEITSDLHAGVTKADMCLKQIIEATAWIVVGAALTAPIIVVFIGAFPHHDRPSLLLLSGASLLSGTAAALCGCLVALGLIRQNRFLAYFKNR